MSILSISLLRQISEVTNSKATHSNRLFFDFHLSHLLPLSYRWRYLLSVHNLIYVTCITHDLFFYMFIFLFIFELWNCGRWNVMDSIFLFLAHWNVINNERRKKKDWRDHERFETRGKISQSRNATRFRLQDKSVFIFLGSVNFWFNNWKIFVQILLLYQKSNKNFITVYFWEIFDNH